MQPASSDRPPLGGKHKLLLACERFSRHHYFIVFAAAAVLAALGGWLGSRLALESDILALIPRGNAQVDVFKEAIDEFGSISYLVVLVDAEEGAGADEIEEFADLLATELEALEELVDYVEYRFLPDEQFVELFYDNALLFLPPERLPELAARLEDEAILRQIEQNRLSLSAPTATLTEELMVHDPLGLMPLFLNRLFGNHGVLRMDVSDGYFLAPDGRALIMLVKPAGPWQDLAFDEKLLEAVRAAEQRARKSYEEENETAAPVGLRYGGHYAIAVDEARLIREDIRFNLIVSLVAVLILYWLCYRRIAALLYCTVPLLVGQALTFGLAFFVLRELNAASAAFTALLMGLGTDFVIVMYARYVEERRLGRPLGEATERMVGETGLGVFTGAITSAGTFYAMCISEFRGLRDLGFLIGSGILFCALAIVFLVPAMIKWNEGVRPRRVESLKKLHVQSFLLERLIPFSARHRVAVLVTLGLLTAAGGVLALQIDFDDTIQVLRSDRSPAYRLQRELSERFGASLSYMMVIVDAPTQERALELTHLVETRLQPFLDSGMVSSHDSLTSYLPPQSQQERILQALREDQRGEFDPRRIRETFLAGLERQGFRSEPFAAFLERLPRFLAPQRPLRVEDLRERGLGSIVDRYVVLHDDRVRTVTYLYLGDPRWRREAPPELAPALSAGEPDIVVTGTNVVNQEFRRIFLRESPRAVLLGLLVVFVLLWIDFRNLRLTAIAMAQLVSGVLIMLGLMKVFDIHLNYVNAFVTTMILGVGIDYGIHVVHRLSASGGRIEPGLLETGKAVVIASFTNMAAFGTLALGNYPALQSFGKVALFGSLTCMFTSLTLVPALMGREDPATSHVEP